MDFAYAHEWGRLFASPWEERIRGMEARGVALGFDQEVVEWEILWGSGASPRIKFCFVDDPSELKSVRRIFNDARNASVPLCFMVATQPDPSETRSEITFDIFRMSPQSYLWHFNQVYTPAKRR